ncbi:DNA cytosine methyltransferase [Hymenobacter metallilatus]|uniref:Cytosine-specific methyltransferase n=1 Tax=Hymenobacter metallilatus TaxID=2493666 RepID=A0A428IXZ3_9BACT|nr:DNA cytosine methyltransferase [Hymenobacter metallilatus]RSK23945.1 DNA cytosine methyltransferase [Hymenobacter metallilatus]
MKAIDLFCGCGGLTEGLKNAGYEVVGAVDNEPIAVKTYRINHPGVYVWEQDIKDLKASHIFKETGLREGQLDLLAGCPPCQGFSRLTTLNGSIDTGKERRAKNELLFQFERLVKVLRPKAIMLENVPALYDNSRLQRFLKTLDKLGYHSDPKDVVKVLNVAAYGVPQRRRRLILMTTLGGPVEFAKPLKEKQTVRDVLGLLRPAGQSGDSLHDLPDRRSEAMMQRIRDTKPNGGSRGDLPLEQQPPCHREQTGFRDVYGRMKWDDVSPTMTSGCNNPSKGRFLHPEEHRAITLREAALFQSFPKDYHFCLDRGKQAVALMIGNALPPVFIEAHAVHISEALRKYQLA